MDYNSLYLISNGSTDFYPENRLTSFTNHLPVTLDFPENVRWEVGVESFGISCNFDSNTRIQKTSPVIMIKKNQGPLNKHPVGFGFDTASENWTKLMLSDNIIDTQVLSAISNQVLTTGLKLTFDANKLIFSLSDEAAGKNESYWLCLEESFCSFFSLTGNVLAIREPRKSNELFGYNPYAKVSMVEINYKVHKRREAEYEGKKYFVFLISASPDTSLSSEVFSMDRGYPKVVKIVCNVIEPQIFNGAYSKDLIIFSPDFRSTDDYFYKEIECIDYIPIQNNKISDISIQLLDENNKFLNLLTGHATLLKLVFRKMPLDKKSFNLRLSSAPTALFPDNTNYHFKVQLPHPIALDEGEWKVCLNSINHPSKFSTMLHEEQERIVIFKREGGSKYQNLFKQYLAYNDQTLISEFNFFLEENRIGSFKKTSDNQKLLSIEAPGKMLISRHLAIMLGYKEEFSGHLTISSKKKKDDTTEATWDASHEKPKLVAFSQGINVDYLKPNYIMLYSDIVKSSIIAGDFAKILKIVPLKATDLNYVIQEFKSKEFVELDRTQLETIEVQLRSHDGSYLNFLTDQDVLINLEISNYHE
jgi:hypothetical protein